jgi:glutamate synthase domain-containing protein 1
MQTDTEVIAYAADLLMRRHGLSPRIAASAFAAPLWHELEVMDKDEQALHRAIRQTYGSVLLNGPFTIIVGRNGEMLGLGDRIRLRPLVAGISGDILYVSSELAPVHLVDPNVEHTWTPMGGEPVIGRLGQKPQVPLHHAPVRRPESQRAEEAAYV